VILANTQIQRALDAGDLVIDPEPGPRDPADPRCPYDTTSVNLRLGDLFSVAPARERRLPLAIDLRAGGVARLLAAAYQPVQVASDGNYCLEPGAFVLGSTVERVTLPVRPDRPCLAARVEGKSSFARSGLIVHLTAPTIHAGFSGHITLELKNLGEYPILLFPGMPIAQLIVERVDGFPATRISQFQEQTRPEGR
jgi:dCTP deaminase